MGSQAAFTRLADGGRSWRPQQFPGATRVSLPRFFNPAEGVLVTDKGVYRSQDGGATSGGRAGTRSYSRAREHVRPSMPSARRHIASDAPAWQVLVAVALVAAPSRRSRMGGKPHPRQLRAHLGSADPTALRLVEGLPWGGRLNSSVSMS